MYKEKDEFWRAMFLAFATGAMMMTAIFSSGAVDFKDTWTESDMRGELAVREQRRLDRIERLEQELEELR